MSYVHLNEPSGCKCGDLPGVSNDATSTRAVCGFDSTAAAWFRCSKEPLLCLCRSSVFLCLRCFGLLRSQTGSLGSTNIPCSASSWVRNGNRCRHCLSHCSHNLRLPWVSLVFNSQPRDVLIQSMLLSLQCSSFAPVRQLSPACSVPMVT